MLLGFVSFSGVSAEGGCGDDYYCAATTEVSVGNGCDDFADGSCNQRYWPSTWTLSCDSDCYASAFGQACDESTCTHYDDYFDLKKYHKLQRRFLLKIYK